MTEFISGMMLPLLVVVTKSITYSLHMQTQFVNYSFALILLFLFDYMSNFSFVYLRSSREMLCLLSVITVVAANRTLFHIQHSTRFVSLEMQNKIRKQIIKIIINKIDVFELIKNHTGHRKIDRDDDGEEMLGIMFIIQFLGSCRAGYTGSLSLYACVRHACLVTILIIGKI